MQVITSSSSSQLGAVRGRCDAPKEWSTDAFCPRPVVARIRARENESIVTFENVGVEIKIRGHSQLGAVTG